MAEEFGPWVSHDGSGCPQEVQVGRYIQAVTRAWDGSEWPEEGVVHQAVVESPCWWMAEPNEIFRRAVRYRLRRPPAVRLLVDLVEGLPAPVREREDA